MNFPSLQEYLERLNPKTSMGGSGDIMAQLKRHTPDMQNPLAPPPAVAEAMQGLMNPTVPPKGIPGLGGNK